MVESSLCRTRGFIERPDDLAAQPFQTAVLQTLYLEGLLSKRLNKQSINVFAWTDETALDHGSESVLV
jgi:hypothetical protein